ncbi:hypothetical protein IE81DRAFT_22285 [Ceraceosorus guamensis]|uniref:Uncharacterized protein n=1 Tax=Ceraceosorus guamensis TaxID=1522189 RepID=A0A316VQM4_9BASI|nr:hypothetical protein IE81DRAFT_22285 [Ceraceosorus guamensis]PWN39544.1 hypothetical protein IE81DRAFT_22285 [Ceraceosorus guamensis]
MREDANDIDHLAGRGDAPYQLCKYKGCQDARDPNGTDCRRARLDLVFRFELGASIGLVNAPSLSEALEDLWYMRLGDDVRGDIARILGVDLASVKGIAQKKHALTHTVRLRFVFHDAKVVVESQIFVLKDERASTLPPRFGVCAATCGIFNPCKVEG